MKDTIFNKIKNNDSIIYLIRSLAMLALGVINIYIMEWKLVNFLFGALPFFIVGIYQLWKFIETKKKRK